MGYNVRGCQSFSEYHPYFSAKRRLQIIPAGLHYPTDIPPGNQDAVSHLSLPFGVPGTGRGCGLKSAGLPGDIPARPPACGQRLEALNPVVRRQVHVNDVGTDGVFRVADRIPPWSIYRILVGVSWLYATAILLQTKEIKLVIILNKLIENRDTSPYLRSRLRPIYRLTMQGFSLGEALCKTATRWPDRILADDLRTYAALPGFNQQLGSIAEEMLEDSVEKIQAGASVMGVMSILLLSLTIIIMVLGLLSINQQVTQGLGL